MKKALAIFMMSTVLLGMGAVVSAEDMNVHVTYMDIDLWDELKEVDVVVNKKTFTKLCDYTIDFDPVLFKADEVKGYYYDPEESYYYTDEDEASLEVYLMAGEAADTEDIDADEELDEDTEEVISMGGDMPDYITEVVNAKRSIAYTLMDDVNGVSLSIPEDMKYQKTGEYWSIPFEATNDTENTIVIDINDLCINGMSIPSGQLLFVEPGETIVDELLVTKYDLDCLEMDEIRYLYFSYRVENDEDMKEIVELTWSPLFLLGDEIVKDPLPYGDEIYADDKVALYVIPEAYLTNQGEMVHFQYLAENKTDEYVGFYGLDPVKINGEEVEDFSNYMSYLLPPQMAGYQVFAIEVNKIGLTSGAEIEEIEFPFHIVTRDSDNIDIETEPYSFVPIMEDRG